jgi:hypothetical protein
MFTWAIKESGPWSELHLYITNDMEQNLTISSFIKTVKEMGNDKHMH